MAMLVLTQQGVYEWNDFLKIGADVPDSDLQARLDEQQPSHCCTLIYTSGTTGDPKVGASTPHCLTL